MIDLTSLWQRRINLKLRSHERLSELSTVRSAKRLPTLHRQSIQRTVLVRFDGYSGRTHCSSSFGSEKQSVHLQILRRGVSHGAKQIKCSTATRSHPAKANL